MSANIELKKEVVASISEKIKNSKSVVLVHFHGLTVAEDTAIRNEFRKAEIEYKVYKNTLVRKAFDLLGINNFDNDLNGPTAVAFGNDETGAAKQVVEAAKKYADKVNVKSGYIAGEVRGYSLETRTLLYACRNPFELHERTCSRDQGGCGQTSRSSGLIRAEIILI